MILSLVQPECKRFSRNSLILPRRSAGPKRVFPLCSRTCATQKTSQKLRAKFALNVRTMFRQARGKVRTCAHAQESVEAGITASPLGACRAPLRSVRNSVRSDLTFYKHVLSCILLAQGRTRLGGAVAQVWYLCPPSVTPAREIVSCLARTERPPPISGAELCSAKQWCRTLLCSLADKANRVDDLRCGTGF